MKFLKRLNVDIDSLQGNVRKLSKEALAKGTEVKNRGAEAVTSLKHSAQIKRTDGKSSSVKIRCSNCSYETMVSKQAMKNLLGAGLVGAGAYGWVNYTFAGLLGFYGGAALIAGALVTGGVVVLSQDNSNLIHAVGKKIAKTLSKSQYKCEECGNSDWIFAGYGNNKVITGKQHIQELRDSIKIAENSLVIVSGFMSSYVVNQDFTLALKQKLEQGCMVTLIFPTRDEHAKTDWMLRAYDIGISNLDCLSFYSEFKIVYANTHQKGIVVDSEYAIVGSYNFLMNARSVKEESSIKVYDVDSIDSFRDSLEKG